MATIPQAFYVAVKHHHAGKLHEAEQIYRQILQIEPRHAGALHLLGLVAHQVGRSDLAVAYISEALRINPDDAEAHHNLGSALLEQRRPEESVACFQTALRLKPDNPAFHHNLGLAFLRQQKLEEAAAGFRQAIHLKPTFAEAHNNLGLVLLQQQKLDEAAACFEQAVRLLPAYAEAHNNLGAVLHKQRKLEDAAASFQRAVHLNPGYAEAHYNLGLVFFEHRKLDEAAASFQSAIHLRTDFADAHNQLGLVLSQKQQLDGAAVSFQQAIHLRPDFAEAYNNLGALLLAQRKLPEAAACFQQAVRVAPNYADAHNNLGVVHIKQGKPEEAVACLQEALRLKPENADAHSNLGNALKSQLKLEEALASYERALALKPDHAEAHWNRALTWLLMGNFQRGWPEYEWRWKKSNPPPWAFEQPLWDGRPLEGRPILLHAEQGLGDTLQFIRYASLVKARGGKVIVQCQDSLLRLLARCPGVDQVVAHGSTLPEFEFHAPLLSLPHLLGSTLATIPAEIPYLFPDDALAKHWGQELGGSGTFKIAIAWQGAPGNVRDAERSVPLVEFARLAQVAGTQLVSLQKGPGSEQIGQAADRLAVMDLGAKTSADFMDSAAILRNVDLVVTVDTALAHLAGALGVPVWVALPFYPDWRWLLDRDDSPWYPTMRLFRQTERGNWQEVFERMRAALSGIRRTQNAGTQPGRGSER